MRTKKRKMKGKKGRGRGDENLCRVKNRERVGEEERARQEDDKGRDVIRDKRWVEKKDGREGEG